MQIIQWKYGEDFPELEKDIQTQRYLDVTTEEPSHGISQQNVKNTKQRNDTKSYI